MRCSGIYDRAWWDGNLPSSPFVGKHGACGGPSGASCLDVNAGVLEKYRFVNTVNPIEQCASHKAADICSVAILPSGSSFARWRATLVVL